MVTLNKQHNCLKHREQPTPGQPEGLAQLGPPVTMSFSDGLFFLFIIYTSLLAFRPLSLWWSSFWLHKAKTGPPPLPSISKTASILISSFFFCLEGTGYQHTQASFCMLWDPFIYLFIYFVACLVCGILIPRPGIEPESPMRWKHES